jgi:hypothetical protein
MPHAMPDHPSQFLLIKAKGGMGNRMLCTVSGLLYARLARRMPVVDWRDNTYSADGINAFPAFFTTPNLLPPEQLPASEDIAPPIWKGHVDLHLARLLHRNDPSRHSSIFIHRKYSIDVRRLDYPEKIAVFWYYTHRINQLRSALHQRPDLVPDSSSTTAILRHLLIHDLPLQPHILDRIQSFQSEYWSDDIVGVHVRYTDLRTDLDAYDTALARHFRGRTPSRIFLATDNPDIITRYRQRYPDVVTTTKWYPESGRSLHQNAECDDRVRNGVEALVDMHLLSRVRHLIYPGSSTFSCISAMISGLPPEHTQDIERSRYGRRIKRWLRDRIP